MSLQNEEAARIMLGERPWKTEMHIRLTKRVSPIPTATGRQARSGNDAGRNLLTLAAVEAIEDSARPTDTKLPRLDSNQDKENQNLLCYRYTTG